MWSCERYNPYKSLMTSTSTAAHTAKDINSDVPMAVETDIVDDKLDGHKEFPFEDAMEAETNVLQEDYFDDPNKFEMWSDDYNDYFSGFYY